MIIPQGAQTITLILAAWQGDYRTGAVTLTGQVNRQSSVIIHHNNCQSYLRHKDGIKLGGGGGEEGVEEGGEDGGGERGGVGVSGRRERGAGAEAERGAEEEAGAGTQQRRSNTFLIIIIPW